ncbi:hypothetical protein C1646_746633 [Rhizophagus diaphanus]|nr:hypothetical protein C1646_746633 [Rhizophagus diaphanus] [Rhizophagus sp. MUCL 43196]
MNYVPSLLVVLYKHNLNIFNQIVTQSFNDLTEIVSEGSALVYAGYWKNTTKFAIKTKEVINQINEIHLTEIVNPHPNIIQFCGVMKLKGETNYSLVLEYATGGTLENI